MSTILRHYGKKTKWLHYCGYWINSLISVINVGSFKASYYHINWINPHYIKVLEKVLFFGLAIFPSSRRKPLCGIPSDGKELRLTEEGSVRRMTFLFFRPTDYILIVPSDWWYFPFDWSFLRAQATWRHSHIWNSTAICSLQGDPDCKLWIDY